MRKSTIFGAIAAIAVFCGVNTASAKSYVPQQPVEPCPLPACVTSVSPAQGIINLDGSQTVGSPLGAGYIGITFTSVPELNLNQSADNFIEIYVDGAKTPAERISGLKAYVDAMGFPTGGFDFKGSYTGRATYHIVVPEGVWLLNGEPTPKIELNYEVTRDFIVTPGAGVVEKLDEFTLICASSFATTYNGGISLYKQGSASNIPVTVTPIEPDAEGADQNAFLIKVDGEPVITPGIYNLEVPQYTFTETWFGPDYSKTEGVRTIKSQAQIFVFIVPELPVPGVVPADNATVLDLDKITVTIPNLDEYSFLLVDDKVANYLYSVSEDGVENSIPVMRYTAQRREDFAKSGIFDLVPGIGYEDVELTPGNYVLRLGNNLYSASAKGGSFLNSAPYEFKYNLILDPTVYEIVTDQAVEVSKLENIEIRFPQANYVVENTEAAEKMYIKDEKGNKVDVELTLDGGGISPLAEEEEYTGSSITVVINPAIVQKGAFTLVIPEGALDCDTFANKAIEATYKVDGTQDSIEEIVAGAETVTVYNAAGILVLDNANVEAVEALEPGLYIINGKKVVLTK